jgi:hypothetical protein
MTTRDGLAVPFFSSGDPGTVQRQGATVFSAILEHSPKAPWPQGDPGVRPLPLFDMKLNFRALVFALLLPLTWSALAQERIYRCGNEYTNSPGDAKARGCRLVEGGQVTVVEGLKPPAAAKPKPVTPGAATPATTARSEAERVASPEQRARDNDARAILEAELRKTEARLAGLRTEYNNGEPEKRGPEFRNHQLYLDRVEEMKASIARAESDVAGLRRELGRLGGGNGR